MRPTVLTRSRAFSGVVVWRCARGLGALTHIASLLRLAHPLHRHRPRRRLPQRRTTRPPPSAHPREVGLGLRLEPRYSPRYPHRLPAFAV